MCKVKNNKYNIYIYGMDYIIIAVIKWKEVLDILDQHGINESKIIRSTAFYSPCFDLDDYLKLKNSNISILANYCLGGFIYKELGLKVLSPTVNMFCLGDGYLEFLENYPYYLSLQMEEYENDTYIEGTIGREAFLPKGILGNKVVWYFNHHVYAKDAVNAWNEKAKRVNCFNVAAIMILHNDEEAYRFSKLNIDKKLGIYYKNLGGGYKRCYILSKMEQPTRTGKI